MSEQEHVRKQMSVMMEVIDERARQDEQWGGPDHDDGHRLGSWFTYIGKQLNEGRRAAEARLVVHNGDLSSLFPDVDFLAAVSETNRTVDKLRPPLVRARMVKIAALALAAIESIDRKAAAS